MLCCPQGILAVLKSVLKQLVSKLMLRVWLSMPHLGLFCNEILALPSRRQKKTLICCFAAACKGKKAPAWNGPRPAAEGGCSRGAVGLGRASLATGSAAAPVRPRAAGSSSIPTLGLQQMSNGVAHRKRSRSPGAPGSRPAAFALGAAFAPKKGSKEFGLPGREG